MSADFPKTVFVGRQPIYNREMEVVAYELLFRGGESHTSAEIIDADKATSQVLLNTFLEFGLDNIVGELPAFINLSRRFLLGHYQLPLPPDRVVLEVLEDVMVDEELIKGLRSLSKRGYTIALDDFIYEQRYKELIDVADIVKVDLLALNRNMLKKHVKLLRQHQVKLVAEKVETQDDFEFCKALGFDYYQGFFFAKPKTLGAQRIPTNRLAILRILAALQNPEAGIAELEEKITQDVSLSFKLLRYINSSWFALPNKIDSVRRALILLGIQNIRNWVSLLALSGIDDKPHYLIIDAMVRAKMCELLAERAKRPGKDSYFTVGLFSLLDALLDTSMDCILGSLPLSEDVKRAILQNEGDMGYALECVVQYERGAWDYVKYDELDPVSIKDCYFRAIAWAEEAMGALAA